MRDVTVETPTGYAWVLVGVAPDADEAAEERSHREKSARDACRVLGRDYATEIARQPDVARLARELHGLIKQDGRATVAPSSTESTEARVR